MLIQTKCFRGGGRILNSTVAAAAAILLFLWSKIKYVLIIMNFLSLLIIYSQKRGIIVQLWLLNMH